MSEYTKGEPTQVHHLDRDSEFLIELSNRIEIHRIPSYAEWLTGALVDALLPR